MLASRAGGQFRFSDDAGGGGLPPEPEVEIARTNPPLTADPDRREAPFAHQSIERSGVHPKSFQDLNRGHECSNRDLVAKCV